MPCYFPLQGYRSRELTPNGKRKIVFNQKDGYIDLPVTMPCGNCIGCRLERSRQWSVRLMHEASFHELSCFLTLTYSEENLPPDNSLVKAHFQNFMKRLRKSHGSKIRFFHCGEYGDQTGRPHYHAIIFGLDFADKKFYKNNAQGHKMYKSETLEKLWGKGLCSIGPVTPETAAYVARYVMKKVTGDAAKSHYESVNLNTGEIYKRQPEYITMSNRPGIGYDWFVKYGKETFHSDSVVVNGNESLPPKYYLRKLAENDEDKAKRIKIRREIRAKKHSFDSTPERLSTRHTCRLAKISTLKRNLDV